jgi:hypothetical protein
MVRKPRARKLVAGPTALALMSPTFIHANALMSVTAALPFDWPNDPCAAESCRVVATPNSPQKSDSVASVSAAAGVQRRSDATTS